MDVLALSQHYAAPPALECQTSGALTEDGLWGRQHIPGSSGKSLAVIPANRPNLDHTGGDGCGNRHRSYLLGKSEYYVLGQHWNFGGGIRRVATGGEVD